jgi:hypothetical protein
VIYRGFPQRLHHRLPHWVEPGALFHIRLALDREKEQKALLIAHWPEQFWIPQDFMKPGCDGTWHCFF